MPWDWVIEQWEPHKTRLTLSKYQDGESILQRYYTQYLQSEMLRKPVAVEEKIQGTLRFEGIEFSLKGRYNRLDWNDLETTPLTGLTYRLLTPSRTNNVTFLIFLSPKGYLGLEFTPNFYPRRLPHE
ncbi:hypothetical protein [Synechococcus sp. PCC 6312]|uniref:hypothetical protein n=1 Tax=Synechococcus sp. (strain ATCC 27167 / PCC 6312) TaxID=195253 RepID=UPI000683E426|nr:hypothetical protein [Synechococcus sp. PCC 6312]